MTKDTIAKLQKFRDERKWGKFHTNENLAKAISIEASEIMELFLWDNKFSEEDLENEIADVASYLYLLAEKNGIDVEEAVKAKIKRNEKRFPVEKNQGRVNKNV